jgi:hypothetical protein
MPGSRSGKFLIAEETGMKIIFTLCSNNYLAQAQVLCKSVQQHEPGATFVIGLTDEKLGTIDYASFGCEVLEVSRIEKNIITLAKKYSIVEFNTCVKPRYFEYFFQEMNAEQVIYMDPDICMYQPLLEIDEQLQLNDFVLTPHTLSPIPLDGHTPAENLFLNYGLFNLGFLAVKSTSQVMQFLTWWKERTYELGYYKTAIGLFTDQIWINLVPIYFKQVAILNHPGYNMAPWNLHERKLDTEQGYYRVNQEHALVFFHFSGFHPGHQKLHKEYTRHQWTERPDMHSLYDAYRISLEKEKYHERITIPCYYAGIRENYLHEQKAIQQQKDAAAFALLPYHIKMTRNLKKMIPGSLKQLTLNLIKT